MVEPSVRGAGSESRLAVAVSWHQILGTKP